MGLYMSKTTYPNPKRIRRNRILTNLNLLNKLKEVNPIIDISYPNFLIEIVSLMDFLVNSSNGLSSVFYSFVFFCYQW